MVLKADQQRVKALLAETITLLCKNGLHFKTKFSIEGLIGITLDEEDIFLVNINKTIRSADSSRDDVEDTGAFEPLPQTGKRVRNKTDLVGTKVASGPGERPTSPAVLPLVTNSSIPKIPSSSHPRSTRVTRQTSPHSITAKSFDSGNGTRTADVSLTTATGPYGNSSDNLAEMATDSLPSTSVCLSENNVASFSGVSIKNDTLSGEDSKPLPPEDTSVPEQPASKRIRLGLSDVRSEQSATTSASSDTNVNYSVSAEPTKSEPPDVIEIKEESLSDDESQLQNYSAYDDYGAAMYSNAGADMTPNFGETSMFQTSGNFFTPQHGEEQTSEQNQSSTTSSQSGLMCRRTGYDIPGSYECVKCNQRFTWMAGLLHHQNSKHGRRPHPFHCQLCQKGFWNQRSLRGHLASKHDMQKDFSCTICGREYSYKGHLKTHMRSCHDSEPLVTTETDNINL